MAECQPLQYTLWLALSTAGIAEWLGSSGEAVPMCLLWSTTVTAADLEVSPEVITAL